MAYAPWRISPITGPQYWFTWVFAVGLAILFVIACVILYHQSDKPGADEVH